MLLPSIYNNWYRCARAVKLMNLSVFPHRLLTETARRWHNVLVSCGLAVAETRVPKQPPIRCSHPALARCLTNVCVVSQTLRLCRFLHSTTRTCPMPRYISLFFFQLRPLYNIFIFSCTVSSVSRLIVSLSGIPRSLSIPPSLLPLPSLHPSQALMELAVRPNSP